MVLGQFVIFPRTNCIGKQFEMQSCNMLFLLQLTPVSPTAEMESNVLMHINTYVSKLGQTIS